MFISTDFPDARDVEQEWLSRNRDRRGLTGLLVLHRPDGSRFRIGGTAINRNGRLYLIAGDPAESCQSRVRASDCELVSFWPPGSGLRYMPPRRVWQKSPPGDRFLRWPG